MSNNPSTFCPSGIKPNIGDTISASLIGRVGGSLFVWLSCPDCRTERWVHRNLKNQLCGKCGAVHRKLIGEKNPRWGGGVRHADGYNYISVPENHPFIKMANKTFVHGKYRYCIAEHRLVVAQRLGRCLDTWEVVHHIDGDRSNNRPDNLELMANQSDHLSSIFLQKRISDLESRVTLLESENVLLKSLLSGGRDSVPDKPETETL